MKPDMKFVASALLAVLAAVSPVLAVEVVDATEVATALTRGAIVWDVRSADAYAAGHIPGAVNIGKATGVLRNPNTEDLLPVAEVEMRLNGAGIDLRKEIIVYGDRGHPYAYWALTTLRHLGARNARISHGGIDAWRAAGNPVSTEPTARPAVEQTITIDPTVLVHLAEVASKVGRADVQFLDVRSTREFSGDIIGALRGGHIPGALNIPFEQNWMDPDAAVKLASGDTANRDGMALKSPTQLQALYADLDPNQEIIVYCQSGTRASETAEVLRSLGFDQVRVFEESWLGYGNDLSLPAESVQFVNIGALNRRIKSLEADIERLTAEVAALSKPASRVRPPADRRPVP